MARDPKNSHETLGSISEEFTFVGIIVDVVRLICWVATFIFSFIP